VGTFGDVAVFSVGTKKMVSGGVLVTSDQRVYERALLLGHPPDRIRSLVHLPEHISQVAAGWGANMRSTPLCATLAEDHLERLAETITIKNHHTDSFAGLLARYCRRSGHLGAILE
jgi:dTDP-4-amino-4,6-dideoxygalactose transaminase